MNDQEYLATKVEVEKVRSEVAFREIEIQNRITENMKEVSDARSVASDAKSAVADAKSEVYKWVAGILVVYTALVVGIMIAVLEFLG